MVFENIKNLIRHGNKSSVKSSKSPLPSQDANNYPPNNNHYNNSPLSDSSNHTTTIVPMLSASPPSKAAPPVVTASNVEGLSVPTPSASNTLDSSITASTHSLQQSISPISISNTSSNNNINSLNDIEYSTFQEKLHSDSIQKHLPADDMAQEVRLAEELRQVNQVSANYSTSTSSESKKKQHPSHAFPSFDARYKLIEQLGNGAFSVVYKALDTQTGENVAVKVVDKLSLNTSQRSNILKEVAIMRQLRHKNIVELLDFIESPDHYFIVLELVSGGELFHQIVRLTYFSEDLSRHVITQVAEAIRYLHEEAGVVHRDIKPENLLFYPAAFIPSPIVQVRSGEDADSKQDEGVYIPGVGAGGIGVIKLADFGLSKIIWDAKTMTPCGTVGYTAPEIVNDQRYSKSVDMWALGCVLYTILCGFPPFYDENIQVLTEKVARGEYTFLSPWWDEISKPAKDLVSHLLTVDPDRRYTIDQFLAHPWITQSKAPTKPAHDSPLINPSNGPGEVSDLKNAQSTAQAQTTGSSYFAGYNGLPNSNAGRTPAASVTNGNAAATHISSSIISSDANHISFDSSTVSDSSKKKKQQQQQPKTPKIYAAGTPYYYEETPTSHINPPEGMIVPDKTFMSPAVVAMREAFDVFNAVHRREEENITGGRMRGIRNSGGAKSIIANKRAKAKAGSLVLGELGEEDEGEEGNEEIPVHEISKTLSNEEEVEFPKIEEAEVVKAQQPTQVEINGNVDSLGDQLEGTTISDSNSLSTQPIPIAKTVSQDSSSHSSITSPTSPSSNSSDKFFELSLEGSTLIERRKRASSSGSVAALAHHQNGQKCSNKNGGSLSAGSSAVGLLPLTGITPLTSTNTPSK